MKLRQTTLLFLLLSIFLNTYGQLDTAEYENWYFSVKSTESTMDSTNCSSIQATIHFFDTSYWGYALDLSHEVYGYDQSWQNSLQKQQTDWWQSGSTVSPTTGFYYPGDSINVQLSFCYNTANLPFSYRGLIIDLVDSSSDASMRIDKAFVYFTPYNTVEVWNYDDFLNLKRDWDSPEDGLQTGSRQYIHPDSIPISNLSDLEFVNDSFLIQYLSISGLGYAIPVKGYTDEDENVIMNGNSQFKADGCGHPNKQRYKGQITGNIRAFISPDRAGIIDMAMGGIAVSLYDKDYGLNPDDFLGSAFADDDGNFVINVDVCQNFQGINQPEGDDLELYIRIIAKDMFTRVRVRNRLGGTLKGNVGRSNTISWAYNNGNNNHQNLGTFRPGKDNTKVHLVHYAHQCFIFVNDNLPGYNFGGSGKELVIIRTPFNKGLNGGVLSDGDFMLPGALSKRIIDGTTAIGSVFSLPVGLLSGMATKMFFTEKDGIYRDFTDDESENTAYHEFGHYLMWHLQNKSFNFQLPFKDHSLSFNSGQEKLAWTEGWAEGFAQIMDIVMSDFDNEAGNEHGTRFNYEKRELDFKNPEDIAIEVRRGNVNNRTKNIENTVTHGLVSEMNIATMLVDLYDGSDNPNVIGGSNAFSDAGIWTGGKTDKVQLTFLEICQPLINMRPNDNISFPYVSTAVIQNVFEYGSELIAIQRCNNHLEIREVFIENRISDFSSTNQGHLVNSDNIAVAVTVDYPTFKLKTAARLLFFHTTKSASIVVDKPEIGPGESFEFPHGVSSVPIISDPLTVDEGILRLNMGIPFTICNGHLILENGGIMEVGNNDVNTVDEAKVISGTSLIIKPGLVGSPSKLEITNGKLTIDNGATLQIHPNTQIILNGPNAVLEIKGNLILEPGAEFKPIGGSNGIGRVIFDISGIQNGTQAKERITVGTNSKMVFEATSNSTTLLEIRGQGLWLDDGGTNFSFTLKNAKAELAHDAMLNLGCKAVFDGAHVRKKAGAGFYRGVYLWGNPGHVVKNSSFQDGEYGLYYGSTKFGIRLNVEGSDFSNNWAGLQMLGGGISMKNSTLSNNSGYGMYAQGLLIPGKVSGANFSDNGYRGLVYESNASAGLFVSGCNLKHNTDMGLKYISQGDLRIKCSHIEGLSGRVTPTGLEMFAGNLLVSSGRLGGLNLFRINNANIHSNDLWGAPVLFLDKGFNQFSSRVTAGDPENGLTGIVNMSSGAAGIPASQNRWDDRTTGANSPVTVFGGSGFENYFLRDPFNGNLLVSDPNPLSASALTNALITSCVTEPTDNNKMMLYAGTGDNFPGDGPIINTYNFPNKTLGDAMDDVLNRGMDSLYDLSDLAGFWSEILAWGGYTVPVDAKTEFYLDLALNGALAVIGEHFALKGLVEPTDINDEMVQTVLNAFDTLSSRVNNVTTLDTFSFRLKNNVHLKKAHLLLTLDQLADASIVLNNMASWADVNTSSEVDYWLCQISNFNTLNADPYNYLTLDSLPSCLNEQQQAQATLTSDEQASDKFESVLNLYPNPAGKTLNLEYINNNQTTDVIKVEILDPVGKTVKSYGHVNLSNKHIKLDISSLASGTYFVRIQAGEQVYVRKLVVE